MTSYFISEIEIQNFKSFKGVVTISDVDHTNNIFGLFTTVGSIFPAMNIADILLKEDVAAAIFFALGATADELEVAKIADLTIANEITSVQPILGSDNYYAVVKRQLLPSGEETFHVNYTIPVRMHNYMKHLTKLGFDIKKQIHFICALNLNFFWKILTSERDELIDVVDLVNKLTDSTEDVYRFFELLSAIDDIKKIIEENEVASNFNNHYIDTLKTVLPFEESDWDASITSCLKREEEERIEKKGELQQLLREHRDILTSNDVCSYEITTKTANREAKVARNRELSQRLQELVFFDFNNGLRVNVLPNVLLFKNRIFKFKNSIATANTFNDNCGKLIAENERYKITAESNIALMTTLNGTKKRSAVLTEDALTKLYPIFHGSDELEMDELELELLEKKDALNKIKFKNETTEYFEAVLPNRSMKEAVEAKDVHYMFSKLQDSLKGMFHPNAYLHDELQLEILLSEIPSSKGFLLCKALQPVLERHENLINNILNEYKYTIVLYKNEMKNISAKLKQTQNVRYLVLTHLPDTECIPPPDHWLNHCFYKVNDGDATSKSKLLHHLGTKLNILCVNTHCQVQDEFERKSKKYVASIDGQLIYARNALGIDVLMYFKPGKKVNKMRFPEACELLNNAHTKILKMMAKITETENVPSDINIENVVDLEAEVNQLEANFADKVKVQIDQIKALRKRCNEPKDVSVVQNYDQGVTAQLNIVDNINQHIARLQQEIGTYEEQKQYWSTEINKMTNYIKFETELEENENEIKTLNEAIKKKETEMKKNDKAPLTMKIAQLTRDIKNLKYKTMETVMRADREGIDLNILCVTTPPTLFQDIKNGTFVDPISIRFNDATNTLNDKITFGKREWHNKLTIAEGRKKELLEINKGLVTRLTNYNREHNVLYEKLITRFNHFNNTLAKYVNDIAKDLYPDCNIEYELKFNCFYKCKVKMIRLIRNGKAIGFENVSYLDQVRTHWLLLAAFHQYSHTPFIFIDLTRETYEVMETIAPIIRRISESSQLFINCSDVHQLTFGKTQFGTDRKVDGARVIKHKSELYGRQGPELGDDDQPDTNTGTTGGAPTNCHTNEQLDQNDEDVVEDNVAEGEGIAGEELVEDNVAQGGGLLGEDNVAANNNEAIN